MGGFNSNSVAVTYVPADCGSIIPGKSKAPKAFRDVDIIGRLRAAGLGSITEHHALDNEAQFRVGRYPSSGVRDDELNINVCRSVQESMVKTLGQAGPTSLPPFQLVLGGECGMLPGIVSAFWNHHHGQRQPRIGLIYIDADTDLATPADASFVGTFASMNMTHLLRTPGALSGMSIFCRPDGAPLCDYSNMVYFGTNMSLESNTRAHFQYLFDNDFKLISAASVSKQPEARARSALKYLEDQGVDVIVVHLDVDSIDPRHFPLANVPNFTGCGFEEMMRAVKVLVEHDKVASLVVAEVNPDHDPGLEMTAKLTDKIVSILKSKFLGDTEVGD